MAVRELTDDETATVENILKILIGFNVEQAETILIVVKRELKERAVIDE